jgi:uncharacterized protein (UPF0276 family)
LEYINRFPLSRVDDVFQLYRHTIRRGGPIATLIEWDNDVPDFAVLLAEARRADAVLAQAATRRNRRVA